MNYHRLKDLQQRNIAPSDTHTRRLVKEGKVHLDLDDELTRGPLVTHQGEILHEVVKAAMKT